VKTLRSRTSRAILGGLEVDLAKVEEWKVDYRVERVREMQDTRRHSPEKSGRCRRPPRRATLADGIRLLPSQVSLSQLIFVFGTNEGEEVKCLYIVRVKWWLFLTGSVRIACTVRLANTFRHR
jgi:hypothetical protein